MNIAPLITTQMSYDDYLNFLKKTTLPENRDYSESYQYYLNVSLDIIDSVSKYLMIEKKLFNLVAKLKQLKCYVITEPWCGDASQILPVLYGLEVASGGGMELICVLRDQNEALMRQFLTNGSQSIPIVIWTDSDSEVLASWGPRSTKASQEVLRIKEHTSDIKELSTELNKWYENDKTQHFQAEIYEILKNLA